MPETQETDNNQEKASKKKKWRPGAWFWVVLYGVLVLTGLSIGSCYFKTGADRAKFWVEGLLSAGVLSVVIVQAVIYSKQWRVMDRSLVIGTRAYVGIHSVEKIDFEAKRFFIEIENIGEVPASRINVDFEMEVGIATKCIPKGYTPSRWSKPDAPNILTVPRHYDYGRTKLFPGNLRIKIPVALNRWFTDGEISLVRQGDAQFIIRGNINFEDGFNKGKNSPFALRYSYQDMCWLPHPIMSSEEEREYYKDNPYDE